MNLYQHKVQYYETDQMAIVHHSNYIRWMEEARSEHCFLSREGKILNLKKTAPEIFQAVCQYIRE